MNLFEKLYSASKGKLEELFMPLNKKKVKRICESYHDNCLEEQAKLADKYVTELGNVKDWDSGSFEKIIKYRLEMEKWSDQANMSKQIYQELFNEELESDDITIEDLMKTVSSSDLS